MNSFTKDGDQYSVSISSDEDGFTGRECPSKECEGYFKVQIGTGLKGNIPCHCPYCGHTTSHNSFWTKEQIEYAQSVVLRDITDQLHRKLKKLERRPDPRAFFSIGVKVTGHPYPIHYYREEKLEQEVICDCCTLRYAIYGVFGYCPDCGIHNSLQILNTNLDVIGKMILLSKDIEHEIGKKLIENALEDAVSSIDGFGREVCKIYSVKAFDSNKAKKISFQNIVKAKETVEEAFKINFNSAVSQDEWTEVIRAFQKRHLVAHKMGVIDSEYVNRTGDNPHLIGRKIEVDADEVTKLAHLLRRIGKYLYVELARLK